MLGDDEEKPPGLKASDAEEDMADKGSNNSSVVVYKWSQDSEDVTVTFVAPEGTKKEDISCDIKADSLDLCVGKEVLLSGPLFAKVNSDESTWTFDENRYRQRFFSFAS